MRNPARARLANALDRRFDAIAEAIGRLGGSVDGLRDDVASGRGDVQDLRAQLDGAQRTIAELGEALAALHVEARQSSEALRQLQGRVDDEVIAMLRELLIDDAGNRRRLEAARALPDYLDPFEDRDPLVSICIPTRADRADLLLERAIPSALAQTHANIEVVIVGDGFDPRDAPGISALDDTRLRFAAVTHRIVERDPRRSWFTGATLPRQEARRIAGGAWITDLDDDDALRPDAIEVLLARACADRAEVACGLMLRHSPDGEAPTTIAGFPPELLPSWSGLPDDWQGRACTAAIWHRSLRSFTRTRAAALLNVPGDLFLTLRMARAGVRFSIVDRVVYDYYPGQLWDAQRAGRRGG